MEGYLSDARAVQNGLLGFAFLQSITFLYSLDKLMPKLSKIMIGTIVGLLTAMSLNAIILFCVNDFEIRILHQMALVDNEKEPNFLTDLARSEGYFHLSLVGIVGFINVLIFRVTAFYYKKRPHRNRHPRRGSPGYFLQ